MDLVYNFLNKFNFNQGTSIVVGVSAGEDSMCLLNVLMGLEQKYYFKIIIAHINHKKRVESDEEEHFLKLYATQHHIIFESMSITDKINGNFEAETRKIRYQFYENLVNKYQASYLMTAHHGDDLIETILMRLVRGSSLKGYQAISLITKKENYLILRPLLYVTKEDIRKYIKEKNIPYRVDVTNFSSDYTRNRYRMNILPFLKKENKNVHLKFLKFSNKLEEVNTYLNKDIDKAYQECYHDNSLDINIFLKNDLFLQRLVIENIFQELYVDLTRLTDKHIDLVLKFLLKRKTGSKLSLPGNKILVINYNQAIFLNQQVENIIDSNQSNNYYFELVDGLVLPNGMKFIKIDNVENGNDTLHLDSKDILMPLYVRNRKAGDFIELKGISGKKKVKDIFIDKKISKEKRDMYPIIVDSLDRVVWIPKLKKSKYDVQNGKNCDIIFKCL